MSMREIFKFLSLALVAIKNSVLNTGYLTRNQLTKQMLRILQNSSNEFTSQLEKALNDMSYDII